MADEVPVVQWQNAALWQRSRESDSPQAPQPVKRVASFDEANLVDVESNLKSATSDVACFMEKYTHFKDHLLKNKEIKKAYNELGPEFTLVETIIKQGLKQGLTQKQLAMKLGTKQPVISRLEQGTYNPSIKFLHRVANALDAELKVSIS